jgi:hypothetical protein
MKSIVPTSAIAILAALALAGCSQSGSGNSPGDTTTNSSMSLTNGVINDATNLVSTNSLQSINAPDTNILLNTNVSGSTN